MTADERFDVARCIVRLAYVVCRGQEPENLDVLNAHAKEMADGSDMEAVLAGMLDKGEFATELAQRRQLMGDYLVGKLAGAPGPPGPDVRPQVAAALEAAAKQLTS